MAASGTQPAVGAPITMRWLAAGSPLLRIRPSVEAVALSPYDGTHTPVVSVGLVSRPGLRSPHILLLFSHAITRCCTVMPPLRNLACSSLAPRSASRATCLPCTAARCTKSPIGGPSLASFTPSGLFLLVSILLVPGTGLDDATCADDPPSTCEVISLVCEIVPDRGGSYAAHAALSLPALLC